MIKPAIHYVSADLGSPHTQKRLSYLREHFVVSELGSFNPVNLPFSSVSVSSGRKVPLYYFVRILKTIKHVISLSRISRNDIIIVRGFEFELLCFVLRKRYFVEITDLNQMYFKSQSVRYVLNLVYGSGISAILTSPGFYNVIGSKSYLIWHNIPNFSLPKDISTKRISDRVVYCGYLRNHREINKLSKVIPLDLYGKFNQLHSKRSDFDFSKENLVYHGEYHFKDTVDVYSKYWFAYVGDHVGINSSYNLTNRLYESCMSGTIPIGIANGSYLSNFMMENEIGMIFQSFKDFALLPLMTQSQLQQIACKSRDNLISIIEKDHGILNSRLINASVDNKINNILV